MKNAQALSQDQINAVAGGRWILMEVRDYSSEHSDGHTSRHANARTYIEVWVA